MGSIELAVPSPRVIADARLNWYLEGLLELMDAFMAELH
jgi:hypothetical protein